MCTTIPDFEKFASQLDMFKPLREIRIGCAAHFFLLIFLWTAKTLNTLEKRKKLFVKVDQEITLFNSKMDSAIKAKLKTTKRVTN